MLSKNNLNYYFLLSNIIKISGNNLGNKGAKELASGIGKLDKLTQLTLDL
jgi:hypothetical protein